MLETLVSDMEYVDDMTLLFSSWSDLKVTIKSLHQNCTAMGLTINCRNTKTLAILPTSSCSQPQSILLSPSEDPVRPVSIFQYLGSSVSQDCSNSAEGSSRIVKASQAFVSLDMQTVTMLCVFSSVILQTAHLFTAFWQTLSRWSEVQME